MSIGDDLSSSPVRGAYFVIGLHTAEERIITILLHIYLYLVRNDSVQSHWRKYNINLCAGRVGVATVMSQDLQLQMCRDVYTYNTHMMRSMTVDSPTGAGYYRGNQSHTHACTHPFFSHIHLFPLCSRFKR